ncbi:MAG: hypothetical protein KGH74_01415 [Candidatus Micrarchaeota archaeon]|nr:hypothetical protein [Candidatus Micrarchaeota archaeon]
MEHPNKQRRFRMQNSVRRIQDRIKFTAAVLKESVRYPKQESLIARDGKVLKRT